MSEGSLVDIIISSELKFPWRREDDFFCATEVKSVFSRADIVYFKSDGDKIDFIIAVEAKLRNWKVALKQAYRNKLFANRTYVALPKRFSSAAISNISEFKKASVGLIVVEENNPGIYFNPPVNNFHSPVHFNKVCESLKMYSLAKEVQPNSKVR
jgi:hypothetical protein